MRDRYGAGLVLGRIAARQHGVISREQAIACGVKSRTLDRRVAEGTWQRLYPGVYRLAGAPTTRRQTAFAACLAWGDDAVISHRAAACLFDLAGLKPGALELTVPPRRRRALPHLVYRSDLPRADVTVVDAIPVTTPARTLIDVATVCDADVVEEALDDALRRRLVTPARLRWRLRDLRGRPGTKLIAMLLAMRTGTPESVLETRFLRVLRSSGLPAPQLQHRIGPYRVDFAYPDARVAIECDGYAHHASRRQFEADRARRNAITAKGWTVLHVTWDQLTDDAVVDQIVATCRRNAPGWPHRSASSRPGSPASAR
jgi:very-short-patch-repair endonuclease